MEKQQKYCDNIVIRFAGDSGDGMQLAGTQLANCVASLGNDVNTFPDYPSEIRAPEGTLYGVSAYQIHLGNAEINTPGDKIDVLVAMNAASLKVSLPKLRDNGIIIVNQAGFVAKNLKLAGYEENPLTDNSLENYQVFAYDITSICHRELEGSNISHKAASKTKNIFALGLIKWLFNRAIEPTEEWLKIKFAKKPEVLDANLRVLKAGYKFGQIREEFASQYIVNTPKKEPGDYRNITGNNAVALGLVAAAQCANLPLFLGSYPITPATEILHYLAGYKKNGVKHLQAEDEIGGVVSAIGAAYGGYLAATTTSGPGLSLKVEALGMAVILEVPLVVVDVMRAGPSTGLPTKPEQSDLLQAMYGRHGEAPMPVLAATTASDCFDMTIEAARIAVEHMTPVILLTDGYLGQGSEPWKIPNIEDLPKINAKFHTDTENFQPYSRDPETFARPWAIPGTQGLEHRVGGLEKDNLSGNVSHDPKNHELMCKLRAEKIEKVADFIPDVEVFGEHEGDLLVISWGSSYGAVKGAYDKLRKDGKKLSYLNLKYLNPFPKNLKSVIEKFDRIVVPELNLGQLKMILEAKYLKPIISINKVEGSVFNISEVKDKILEVLEGEKK